MKRLIDRYILLKESRTSKRDDDFHMRNVIYEVVYIYDCIDRKIIQLEYANAVQYEILFIKTAELNDDHFYLKEIEDYTDTCTNLISI